MVRSERVKTAASLKARRKERDSKMSVEYKKKYTDNKIARQAIRSKTNKLMSEAQVYRGLQPRTGDAISLTNVMDDATRQSVLSRHEALSQSGERLKAMLIDLDKSIKDGTYSYEGDIIQLFRESARFRRRDTQLGHKLHKKMGNRIDFAHQIEDDIQRVGMKVHSGDLLVAPEGRLVSYHHLNT